MLMPKIRLTFAEETGAAGQKDGFVAVELLYGGLLGCDSRITPAYDDYERG